MKVLILIFAVSLIILIDAKANNLRLNEILEMIAKEKTSTTNVFSCLCWRTDKVIQLKRTLYEMNTMNLHNYKNMGVNTNLKNNLVLFDVKCNNYQEIINQDQQQYLNNVIFINAKTCQDVIFQQSSFTLVKFYLIPEMVTSTKEILQCSRKNLNSTWISMPYNYQKENRLRNGHFIKKEKQPIKVGFIASSDAAKTIKDFRRNLKSEISVRFNYQLFSELFAFLNFKPLISFHTSSDALQGIELLATPMRVHRENQTIYNFITSQTPNKQSFLMKAPSLSSVSNVFTLPLELNVWYASYLILGIIFIVLLVIVKIEWKYPDFVENKCRILNPTIMDVLHMQIGAIAQQGSEAEPTSGAGRIATFLVFLFFLFLYTAYSANIVALLGSTTKKVHRVRDLREFNVKLGVDINEFSKELFKNQQSVEHLALFKEKLAKEDCYMTLDRGIERVRSEFFAFHGNNDQIYKVINDLYADNEKCGFVEISYLSEPDLLIPIRKSSSNGEALKLGLSIFLERGLHSRIKNVMYSKQPQCYNGGTNFVSVSLLDCYFAFLIYGGGILLSSTVLLLEIFASQKKVSKIISKLKTISKHNELLN